MRRIGRRLCRGAPVLLLLAGGCATSAPRGADAPVRTFDAGPLASRTVEPDGTIRLRALGPLIEWANGPDGTLAAARPFYARADHHASGWVRQEILWPFASGRSLEGRQHSWRVMLAYYLHDDPDDPESRWRFWLLPFYYQGRDREGRRYAALFPLGGRIHEFLGQDEIVFALFPLWLRHQINEVRTDHVLWPILSHTEGPKTRRMRVFPFYGTAWREGQHASRFILWPFWTQVRHEYPASQGQGFMLFPLYGRIRRTDQHSDWFLPPWIRFDRAERQRAVTAPWPFFRRRTGETTETMIWPLYRTCRRTGMRTGFMLWPIFWNKHMDRGDVLVSRHKALPFVQTETRTTRHPVSVGETPKPDQRDVRIWPLAWYRREGEYRRFRTLALWPTKTPGPVERNWAPLWTLADHRVAGDHVDTELLWGLYRRRIRADGERHTSLFPLIEWGQTDGGERRWNVLKGLLGVRRRGGQQTVRLLYLFTWERAAGEEAP